MADPILQARGLGIRLRDALVLTDIDLSLSPGDILAVAGPNGAGKTTLLRCLAGILTPACGDVLLDGRPLARLSRRKTARQLAYCPQDNGERLGFTVNEAVLMGRLPFLDRFATPSAADREDARQAMTALDILHLAGRRVTELSGGEKRRVALARTLIQTKNSGGVFLLDEPTAGLDIRHALMALRVYRAKALKLGATVVAVLHDLNLAAMFCPHILLLNNGHIAAYGPTSQALTEDVLFSVFGVRATVDNRTIHFLEDA